MGSGVGAGVKAAVGTPMMPSGHIKPPPSSLKVTTLGRFEPTDPKPPQVATVQNRSEVSGRWEVKAGQPNSVQPLRVFSVVAPAGVAYRLEAARPDR